MTDIAPAAEAELFGLLGDMARELAQLESVNPATVRIGPDPHHQEQGS